MWQYRLVRLTMNGVTVYNCLLSILRDDVLDLRVVRNMRTPLADRELRVNIPICC